MYSKDFIIEANNLTKCYRVAKRKKGIMNNLKWFFSRQYRPILAVDDVTFRIKQGESIGLIGPNGAGKSTIIKMLCGILVPNEGNIAVFGVNPSKHRKTVVKRIGVVYGQRSQLWWDLPLIDSFDLVRYMYRIPQSTYHKNLNELVELLEIGDFIDTPVRQLSLGQKMKAEIVSSLLHNPDILFLDEPTIGLDVVSKDRLREFILHMNRNHGTTILLSTHDLSDIEEISDRILIIDKGKIIYSRTIKELRYEYGFRYTLVVDLKEHVDAFKIPNTKLIKKEGRRFYLRFDHRKISTTKLISYVNKNFTIKDIVIHEPSIEEIIKDIYGK